MGKHKPIYDPSTDCGDYVVAVGCHDLHTTGKKRFQKKYYTHTTRPGSLRSMTMDKMFEKWGGGEVLRRAVRGMLPKNRLRDKRLDRLKSEFVVRSQPCSLLHCLVFHVECLSVCYAHISLTMVMTLMLILIYITAFEGLAHPYKQNIVKLGNTPMIGNLPDVQETLANAKAE
jgi:large subunit ribosomal protein L13